VDRTILRIAGRRWLPEFKFSLIQVTAHVAAWIPAVLIVIDFYRDLWTFNPIQYLTFRTGWAAITLLTASLACSPFNTYFGFREAIKIRRPLGVYAALYALAHFLIFVVVDYGLDPKLIYAAIFEKRYALVGFAAFIILMPLALTSTKGWQRRLGKTWKGLHRWVYLAAVLAVVHYLWLVKTDIRKPLVYAGLVSVFLVARSGWAKRSVGLLRGWITARFKST
jgi:sulfoxide reductase heme-binding subunit YedZ